MTKATPRTDAVHAKHEDADYIDEVAELADIYALARQLERELLDTRDLLAEANAARLENIERDLATQPEEPFPSDREQAGLWRDLVLLDPMDLMVIYGGAENDVVLLGKLKAFIEAKRQEQATPQSERE